MRHRMETLHNDKGYLCSYALFWGIYRHFYQCRKPVDDIFCVSPFEGGITEINVIISSTN
jgi:hypothetical protein